VKLEMIGVVRTEHEVRVAVVRSVAVDMVDEGRRT
jgi:hypothetical protein